MLKRTNGCFSSQNTLYCHRGKSIIPGKQSCGKAIRSRSFGTLMSSVAEDASVRLVASPLGNTSAPRSRLFCNQTRNSKCWFYLWMSYQQNQPKLISFGLPSWWSFSVSGHDWKLDQSTGWSFSPWTRRVGRGPAVPRPPAGEVRLTYFADEPMTKCGSILG